MGLSYRDRVVIPETVLVNVLDADAVLLDLATETYFTLHGSGARMWGELTSQQSIQAAFEALLETFEVPPETLRSDLDGLLHELIERNLLRAVPA